MDSEPARVSRDDSLSGMHGAAAIFDSFVRDDHTSSYHMTGLWLLPSTDNQSISSSHQHKSLLEHIARRRPSPPRVSVQYPGADQHWKYDALYYPAFVPKQVQGGVFRTAELERE